MNVPPFFRLGSFLLIACTASVVRSDERPEEWVVFVTYELYRATWTVAAFGGEAGD